ncbi:MAG: galactose oxidase-like domain-containing protein, partial [Planctomycetota bacterium]
MGPSLLYRMILLLFLPGALHATSLEGDVHVEGRPRSPTPNARVTLFTPSLSFFQETRSDAAGHWQLEKVPEGTYQLGIAARDYQYHEETVLVAAAPLLFVTELGLETEAGEWNVIGNTLPEFLDASNIAYLMGDGRIFYCHNTEDPIIFDPISGAKELPTGSGADQGCMNGTLLGDGRQIFVGGQNGPFTHAVRWVKTWSASESWLQLEDLVHRAGRWYPGLARLADGSLLVMGGGTSPAAERTDTCELFHLEPESWSTTGSMINPAEFPPSALLHSGEVLITWSPPQLFDPAMGTWKTTGDFVQPNRGWPGHSDHSIVVLSDGRVVAIGTRSEDLCSPGMGEIYDPETGGWSLTANAEIVRDQPEVVQLPDGRIFVGAGKAIEQPIPVPEVLGRVLWTDLYDPDKDSWRRVADMQHFREVHAVTLLVPDGRVVTTGGTQIDFQVGPTSADIEAFSPPYLFRGVRPEITFLSTTEPSRGQTIELVVSPATQITRVVLMGTEVVTHWVSAGVPRRLELPVTQVGSLVSVTLPAQANRLPLGRYMLFAMVDDIPSPGRIINVMECPPPYADLIWAAEGSGGAVDSVTALKDALEKNGLTPVLIDDLASYPCLDELDSTAVLWACLGTFPEKHILTSEEGDVLVDLLVNKEISIYIEGSDVWGMDPPTSFADYDGVENGTAENGDDSFTQMTPMQICELLNIGATSYDQDNELGSDSTDRLLLGVDDLAGGVPYAIWENLPDASGEKTYNTGIYYDNFFQIGSVISQSWEFGGFGADHVELAFAYRQLLEPFVIIDLLFWRGDCNNDGARDISDPIFLLGYLFNPPAPTLACERACDANDDGGLDIADVIRLLNALFSAMPLPPPGDPFG